MSRGELRTDEWFKRNHEVGLRHRAGGLLALARETSDLLQVDCLTVSGKTLSQNIETAECFDRNAIKPVDQPIYPTGVLKDGPTF